MKKFKFKIRGNDYNVEILQHERNIINIEVNGSEYEVELEKDVKTSNRPTIKRSMVQTPMNAAKIAKTSGGSTTKVIAPLPGTILKIMVQNGDDIKIGDNLMIMEAMKMENNVLAEKAGIIKSIKVAVGDTVLQNDVLLEIE